MLGRCRSKQGQMGSAGNVFYREIGKARQIATFNFNFYNMSYARCTVAVVHVAAFVLFSQGWATPMSAQTTVRKETGVSPTELEVIPLIRQGDPDLSSDSPDIDFIPPSRLRSQGLDGATLVSQTGDRNQASVQQIGVDNVVVVEQEGTANGYSLEARGDANYIAVRQDGNRNQVVQRLNNSHDNLIEFAQIGDDNIIQHQADGLSAKELSVRQTGNGLEVTIDQTLVVPDIPQRQ